MIYSVTCFISFANAGEAEWSFRSAALSREQTH